MHGVYWCPEYGMGDCAIDSYAKHIFHSAVEEELVYLL